MSFFGSLTGSTQRKRVNQASAEATGYINQGYGQARGELGTANTQAQGYLGQSRTDLGQGYDLATQGTREAQGYIQPYAQTGSNALSMYADANGVNGAPAQQRFMASYQGADPFRQYNEDRSTNALARSYNARGMGNSGVAALASARENLRRGSEDYNSYMGRLQGLSSMGQQAAGQQAGYAAQQGQYGMQYGQGLAGVGAQQAQTATNYGNQLANLSTGQYNALSSNAINRGNALSQADSILGNTLGTFGGLALKAAAGGYGGGGGEQLPWTPQQARWG
jgi:hypothetical protein